MAWYIVNSTNSGNNINLNFVTPSNVYARLTSTGNLKVDSIKNMEFNETVDNMKLTTTEFQTTEINEIDNTSVAMRTINKQILPKEINEIEIT